MGYTIKFNTTIEWTVTDEEAKAIDECETPEAFIAYQTELLKPSYTGRQDLEDFVANGVIKQGSWRVDTEDAVEHMGEFKGETNGI